METGALSSISRGGGRVTSTRCQGCVISWERVSDAALDVQSLVLASSVQLCGGLRGAGFVVRGFTESSGRCGWECGVECRRGGYSRYEFSAPWPGPRPTTRLVLHDHDHRQ